MNQRAHTMPPPADVTGRQQRQVLDLLSDGRWHANTELAGICIRYSARILELRDRGFTIQKVRGTGSVPWYYKLTGTGQLRLF